MIHLAMWLASALFLGWLAWRVYCVLAYLLVWAFRKERKEEAPSDPGTFQSFRRYE